jgi:hypothetical protein
MIITFSQYYMLTIFEFKHFSHVSDSLNHCCNLNLTKNIEKDKNLAKLF